VRTGGTQCKISAWPTGRADGGVAGRWREDVDGRWDHQAAAGFGSHDAARAMVAHQPLSMQLSQSVWTEQSAAPQQMMSTKRVKKEGEVGGLAFADVEAFEREVHGGDRTDYRQLTIADGESRASSSAVWADDESILTKADK
jgi:hypothetical protein